MSEQQGVRRARRWGACVATVAMVFGVAVVGDETQAAAGPQQVVIVNGVTGEDSVDVYIDGDLTLPDLAFGAASAPIMLPDQDEHTVALFAAAANPAATEAARGDAPLVPWSHSGMAGPGRIFHPDDLSILRLANRTTADRWYVFTHPLLDSSIACRPGFTSSAMEASADVNSSGPGGSGSGIFGTGGATNAAGSAYERAVVVKGRRPPTFGTTPPDPEPFTFGSFDFGTVSFDIGEHHTYVTYGNEGGYGAAEIAIDCASRSITSARHADRNPRFPSSRFVPLEPVRLFDTRTPAQPAGAIAPGATLDVQVTGEVGIPTTGVTAVVLNVTATEPAAPGFVTVWPKGAPQPLTSSLNVTGVGQTVPNLVTVPVGDGGEVSFFSLNQVHLLADVAGYFVEASDASAGRFVPVAPSRVFDTREPEPPAGAVTPDTTITVQVAGRNGVPDTGASAVVLNVTGIGLGGPGFITAFPTGQTLPTASNLNLVGAGDVTPNLVIVPLGDDGSVDFYSLSETDILADVFGYFTDDAAASSSSGLFVPTSPVRFDDTRPKPWRFGDSFIDADSSLRVEIAGHADVPGEAVSAVLANATMTESAAAGFMTVWPSTTAQPGTSNLNVIGPNVTRPNAVLVPLGGPGDISLYALAGTHAIIDVFGYFTA